MSQDKFEEIVRQRLQGHETDFDLDSGWSSLTNDLGQTGQQNKSRSKRFLFMFILFFLVGSSAYFILNNETEKTSIDNYVGTELEDPILEEVFVAKNDEQISEKETSYEKIQKEVSLSALNQTKDHRVDLEVIKSTNISKTNETLFIESTERQVNSLDPTGNSIRKNKMNTSVIDPINDLSNFRNLNVQKQSIVINEDPVGHPNGSLLKKKQNALNAQKHVSEIKNIPSLLLRLKGSFANMHAALLGKMMLLEMIHENEESVVDYPSWNIGVSGSVFGYNHNFNVTNNNIEIKEAKSTLKALEAIGYGIDLTYAFSSRLMIRTGVESFQVNELFDYYTSKNVERDTSVLTQLTINVASGDTTSVTSSEIVQAGSEWRQVQHYNAYRMVNIPITMGYQVEKGKWRIGLFGGAILSLNQSKKGRELTGQGPGIMIFDSSESNLYSTSIGWSLLFEPTISYELTNGIHGVVRPQIRRTMTNWSTQETVEQRPTFYGVSCGITKSF